MLKITFYAKILKNLRGGGNLIKFIDLFSGIGGIRKGFEMACEDLKISCKCVFTSEIKSSAIKIFEQNHPTEKIFGDITKISAKKIPNFDILLAGFPCQSFSSAGKRNGFEDNRGTLFFEIERILAEKKPFGFILENVEGLVTHDKGKTLEKILSSLENLNYKVSWKVLNAKNFGVPQDRKRIYIVGNLKIAPNLENFIEKKSVLADILEKNLPTSESKFVKLLLKNFSAKDLIGKSIKDKRGGKNNIHSWDIECKGAVTAEQKILLNKILTERRKKKWAEEFKIDWMDGMPLTLEQIKTFYQNENLEKMLEDLVEKNYLKKEFPKKKVGNKRIEDKNLVQGYNIVAGKLSYEVGKILNPAEIAPTLVATDMQHIFVVDGEGLRQLTMREGLRIFGFPDDFKFEISDREGRDLLGNTVAVPVIKEISKKLLECFEVKK